MPRLAQDLGQHQYSTKRSWAGQTRNATFIPFHSAQDFFQGQKSFFFSTFLEVSLRKIILPVDTLETNNMTKQIRIRSLKPKAWPQPTFAEDLWIQNPSPAGGPYKPPLASPHTSSGKPGFAALKALSFRFNLSCIHFPKLDGICNVLKYAEGN